MLVKEYRCDICNIRLADESRIYNSFFNVKIRFVKYQICSKCKEEIVRRVKENKRGSKMTEEERALSDMLDNERQRNAELEKQIENFNLCGSTVAKTTYNKVVNENAILKKQLKEKECFPQKKDGSIDMCEVMKENAELKMKLKVSEHNKECREIDISDLKKQIKPLEDRICSLKRKNRSLENKVEKMKYCGNCKHFFENGYEYNDCDQYRWWDKCDKWKLAE